MQLAVNPVGNSRPDESLADMEWQAGTGVHGTLTPWERPVRRTSTTEGGANALDIPAGSTGLYIMS